MKKSILGLILASQLFIGCGSKAESKATPTPAAPEVATATTSLTEDEAVLAVNDLMNQQKFEEAIAAAGKGLEQYPESFSLLTNRASIYVHVEQYEKARPDLVKALELSPPESKWTIQSLLGRCAAGQGLLNKAEQEFAKAVELLAKDPKPVPAFEEQLWRLRATNLANDLYYKEAVENYTKALKIQPDKLESLMGRALAYNGAKNDKGFQQDLAAVKKRDPKAAEFLKEEAEHQKTMSSTAEGVTKLGLEKLRAGEHGSAIALFNSAIKKDPKFQLAYEKKGSSLQSLGKFSEAIEAYSKSYQLKPTEVALYNRSLCYINEGKIEPAKLDLQEFLKISKSPPEIEKAKMLLEKLNSI